MKLKRLRGKEGKIIPFTAAGLWVKVVRVVAASYLTACDDAFNSLKIQHIYRAWSNSISMLH